MEEERAEEGQGFLRRNFFKILTGRAIVTTTGFGLGVTYMANRMEERSEKFERNASEGIEATVRELSENDFENYDTGLQEVSSNLHISSGTARLNVEVDAVEINPEELADQLAQGEYLEEGAEIFGIYASNLIENEGLEYLELGFENGILEGSVWYEVEVGDIDPEVDTEDELSQFYRDTVRTNMRTG